DVARFLRCARRVSCRRGRGVARRGALGADRRRRHHRRHADLDVALPAAAPGRQAGAGCGSMKAPTSAADGDPVYVYKPSLIGAPWEFRLTLDAVEWQAGRHRGRIPYAHVSRIRLSIRPVTMQTRRFVTEIWCPPGPRLTIASSSWRSPVEQVAQDRDYGAFVRTLNARVAAAGAQASFETGMPAVLYWPGLAVFVAVAVALTVLAFRAL